MDQTHAVAALGALAQETRLSAFRLLVRAGPEGMIAGAIAEHLGVPASTMSHHLAALERAGLVLSKRSSRLIRYTAHYEGMRDLLGYLLSDCCQGEPALCGDLRTFSCAAPLEHIPTS
ncbi:MAG: metalloregulator ArsR/SmtB family transcription factor [Pseudomonadota bacterium]|nr:metalloregulator ArsR/SmtB family transcription factor [Pseudomonadota bacterium]